MAKTFFRAFFYSILGLGVLFWAIGFLLPSTYELERSTTINAPADKVFALVVDLKKWDQWSPWPAMDPQAEFEYGQNMSSLPYMSWKGPKIGMGRLDIEKVTANQKIETSLRFYTPQDTSSRGTWLFESQGSSTKVTWSNVGALEDVIAKWYGLIMKAKMGENFQQGLAKLKVVAEK